MENLTGLFIDRTGKICEKKTVSDDYDAICKLLDIEYYQPLIRYIGKDAIYIFCDEDGKLKSDQSVSASSKAYKDMLGNTNKETLVGNLFVAGVTKQMIDGDKYLTPRSLNDIQIRRISESVKKNSGLTYSLRPEERSLDEVR